MYIFSRSTYQADLLSVKFILAFLQLDNCMASKLIAQVGSNIREYHQTLVAQLGEENTTLKWNAGSHFKNAAVRTADGFAWNMKSLC